LLVCAPILLPFIAGTRRTWQEGLKAALLFGLARLGVYTLLGGVVGYIGYYLFQLFYSRAWGVALWSLAGAFIIILGLLVLGGKGNDHRLCRSQGPIVLGLAIGLAPCLPLIAVLTEIMFLASGFFQGALYGFTFGLGTVFSPLLLIGVLAPILPGKFPQLAKVFNLICGLSLIGVGLYLLLRLFAPPLAG